MYREFKGHFVETLPSSFVVIDLETTGLSPACHEIIEYAGIKVIDGQAIESFQELAKPDFEIPFEVSEITSITNEMVQKSRPTKEVYSDFIKFIGDLPVLGHNVNFDINFLYDFGLSHFSRPFSNDYIDTLKIARNIIKGLPTYRLEFLCEVLNIKKTDGDFHRALYDCLQTFLLYVHLTSTVNEDNWISFMQSVDRKKKHYYYHKAVDLRTLTVQIPEEELDRENPLYGKNVVFTGTLQRFQRKEAAQIVINMGGIAQNSINKNTDFLVLGNNDYCLSIRNPEHKSSKQLKAEKMIADGSDIKILPEDVFYDLIEVKRCFETSDQGFSAEIGQTMMPSER